MQFLLFFNCIQCEFVLFGAACERVLFLRTFQPLAFSGLLNKRYGMCVCVQFLLFFNWIQYTRMSYANKLYPMWAELVGWSMAMLPVLLILGLSIFKFIRSPADKNFLGVSVQQSKIFCAWVLFQLQHCEDDCGGRVENGWCLVC